MAKHAIILGTQPNQGSSEMGVTFILWLVPGAAPVAAPGVSQYKNASGAELASIQAGTTIEEVYSRTFALNATFGDIANAASELWVLRQAYWSAYQGEGFLANMYTDPTVSGGAWQQG